MKKKIIALGVFASLCGFGVASQASATVVTVTTTGTITQVVPYLGNKLESVHIGDAFKAVYSFDTTQALVNESYSYASDAYGGSTYGGGPFGHVDVTVGDQSYSFQGSFNGLILSDPNYNFGTSPDLIQQRLESRDGTASTYDDIYLETDEWGTFPLDFAQPGTYDLLSDSTSSGLLEFYSQSDGTATVYNYLIAELQHVEVSDGTSSDGGGSNSNSVPEPASLWLLAAGLIGAAFFRRRGAKQHATACA